jgi:hypothetical protein
MKRSILFLLAFALFALILADDAFACSCVAKPTIPMEMEYSKVVVTGRIDSVHKLREPQREHDREAYLSATLVVDKVYSGNVKVGDKLLLAQGGGADCSLTWDDKSVGTKWLFYLGKPSFDGYRYLEEPVSENEQVPMYRTNVCGRSTPVDFAASDLAYLNNLAKLKDKTRISGELYYDDPGEHSVEGIEVRITGKNVRFKTKYKKGGFFEIYDVPPGEYLLELLPPQGWKAGNHWRHHRDIEEYSPDTLAKLKKNQRLIRVLAGSHTDIDLALAPDTLISGRVLSPTGKAMSKVCVSAVLSQGGRDEERATLCTDEKGEFRFEVLTPGNYLLTANSGGKMDDEQPFGKLYYPGVDSRENAGVIAVEAGRYNLGVDLQIPQIARLIEITGRVLFADDGPANGLWVNFDPSDKGKFDRISTRTDAEGRFSLKVPLGAAGEVQGSRYFSEYKYPHCSEIMATVKARGSSEIFTTPLEVTGTEPISNAILRLPFDFCAEK